MVWQRSFSLVAGDVGRSRICVVLDPPICCGIVSDAPDNFASVDGRVFRGARPTYEQARILHHELGVRVAINLEWEQDDASVFQDLPIERVRVKDWEPLPWLMPCLEDQHVAKVLSVIRAGPTPIYIHCRSGQNRTGIAVAAYRLVELRQDIDSVLYDFDLYRGFWRFVDRGYIRSIARRRREFRS